MVTNTKEKEKNDNTNIEGDKNYVIRKVFNGVQMCGIKTLEDKINVIAQVLSLYNSVLVINFQYKNDGFLWNCS